MNTEKRQAYHMVECTNERVESRFSALLHLAQFLNNFLCEPFFVLDTYFIVTYSIFARSVVANTIVTYFIVVIPFVAHSIVASCLLA